MYSSHISSFVICRCMAQYIISYITSIKLDVGVNAYIYYPRESDGHIMDYILSLIIYNCLLSLLKMHMLKRNRY